MTAVTIIAGLQVALVGFLVGVSERERRRMLADARAEREDLLQRIQAPEVAVMQHQVRGPVVMPQHVPMDDDEAFHESREELAERMMAEETSGAR